MIKVFLKLTKNPIKFICGTKWDLWTMGYFSKTNISVGTRGLKTIRATTLTPYRETKQKYFDHVSVRHALSLIFNMWLSRAAIINGAEIQR